MNFNLPPDASLDGHLIDEALIHGHFTEAGLFLFMAVWMLLASLRYGRKHAASSDDGSSRKQIFKTLGLVAGVFIFVDVSLVINSLRAVDGTFWNWSIPESNPNTVKVEVNAHQWAWDLRLPGPDGVFSTADDVIGWNELRIPVDTPIHLQLVSTDVVHGFYLPNFRIKTDVVPGAVRQLWFQATRTGEFEVGCTQHCGPNHYKMRAKLIVLSKEEFKAWSTEASRIAVLGFDPNDLSAHWGWPWKAR